MHFDRLVRCVAQVEFDALKEPLARLDGARANDGRIRRIAGPQQRFRALVIERFKGDLLAHAMDDEDRGFAFFGWGRFAEVNARGAAEKFSFKGGSTVRWLLSGGGAVWVDFIRIHLALGMEDAEHGRIDR